MKKLNAIIVLLLAILVIVIVSSPEDEASHIRIGYIGALSGVGAAVGEEEYKAVRLAVKDINEMGGVGGRNIEIVPGDVSLDKMKDATSVATKLVTVDGVVAIVGPQWDEPAFAIAPVIKELKIPTIGVNNTKDVERELPNEYFFSVWHDNEVGIKEILRYTDAQGYEDIAIIRSLSAGFWQLTRDYFIEHAPSYGITVVADIDVGDFLENDFRTHLTKIKEFSPDAIFMVVSDYNQCSVLKQMNELGLSIPLLSTESAGDQVSLRNCPELLESAYFSTPKETQKYERFAESFQKLYGQLPAFPSAVNAYDAVFVLANAIERRGEGSLRDAIKDTNMEGYSLPMISFDEMGFVSTPEDAFEMRTTRDGKFVRVGNP